MLILCLQKNSYDSLDSLHIDPLQNCHLPVPPKEFEYSLVSLDLFAVLRYPLYHPGVHFRVDLRNHAPKHDQVGLEVLGGLAGLCEELVLKVEVVRVWECFINHFTLAISDILVPVGFFFNCGERGSWGRFGGEGRVQRSY